MFSGEFLRPEDCFQANLVFQARSLAWVLRLAMLTTLQSPTAWDTDNMKSMLADCEVHGVTV